MAVTLDAEVFWTRIARLYATWEKKIASEKSGWKDVDAWFFLVGKSQGDSLENVGETLMLYLLGYTFTDTLFIFTKEHVYALASGKKIKLLEQLLNKDKKGSSVDLVLLEKNNKESTEKFDELLTKLKESRNGKTFAAPLGDSLQGTFASAWMDRTKTEFGNSEVKKESTDDKEKPDETDYNLKDISGAVCTVLSKKDETELDSVKKCSQLATRVMKYACVKRMEDIIDEDLSITHAALSAEIETKIRDPAKVRSKLAGDLCDTVFSPLVQSGGTYSFEIGTEPDNTKLAFDTIIFSIGIRYKDYNSCIARTFMIGPKKEQEKIYGTLVGAFNNIVSSLKPGVTLSEVFESGKSIVSKNDEKLLAYMTPNFGWEMGLVFKNKSFVIKSSNDEKIEAGMAFCVRIGFLNVPLQDADTKGKLPKSFSCLLADTVVVKTEGSELLTRYNFSLSDVRYEIEDSEDEEEEEDDKKSTKEKEVVVVGDNKIQRALRSAYKTKEQLELEKTAANMEKVIIDQQKKLLQDKARRERRKMDEGDDWEDEGEPRKEIVRKFKDTSQYPPNLRRNQMYCDSERECVFVPIFGYHVPFHISTIKSISKNEEEYATILRINFFSPTGSAGFSKDISPDMKAVIEQHPKMAYMKEMSIRSKDGRNLNHQLRLVKELHKKVRARQKKREQEADLVEQADLHLNQMTKKPRLSDISMKPPLHKGKCVGSLTAHTNGFRFRSNRSETFDLIYSNIKHFIFQPCEQELIVLIHFHLKNPVMVGQKTKTRDIQFYAEVVEGSTALDGKKRTMYDPDEIDEEYRERQLRKRLNNAFKGFCDQVVQVVDGNALKIGQNNEYDIPYRELGFSAVPHKEMVLMQPTVHCLVNLTETPFFVVSLNEIEHIHFERTDFRVSKTFDMVFILKKHMKQDCTEVPQRLQSIPVDKFEMIKKWIHENGEITFTCGTTPLNWKNVMVGVREELENKVFWDEWDLNGEKKPIGWNFLSIDDVVESGDEQEDEDPEDSAIDEEELPSESSDGDWDDEDDDEDSSDLEEEEDDEEEEVDDWDELDRKAAASDQRKEKRDRDKEDVVVSHRSKKHRRR